jgi:hypothetical protein
MVQHGTATRKDDRMFEVARSAKEIHAQINALAPLADSDSKAEAAYEALRWVVGMSDTGPADGYGD